MKKLIVKIAIALTASMFAGSVAAVEWNVSVWGKRRVHGGS